MDRAALGNFPASRSVSGPYSQFISSNVSSYPNSNSGPHKVLKNDVFCDVTPCGSCKNRRFGGKYRLLHQGDKNRRTRTDASCNWQQTHAAKEYHLALSSSETSVLTRAAQRNIPEYTILHSHRRENLKSVIKFCIDEVHN
jgi:hypothetical protein